MTKGGSRDDRLKAALKANMARRKAQSRARGAAGDETDDESAPDQRAVWREDTDKALTGPRKARAAGGKAGTNSAEGREE